MAERLFNQTTEPDGRSVLGMLEVQIEKDPKTGATTVRSLSPISTSAAAPKAAKIFDDGRKSIHAVGGAVNEPTSEELGQILNAIGGVGMKVLLDEVTAPPKKVELEKEGADSSNTAEATSLQFKKHIHKIKDDNDRSGSNHCDPNAEISAVGVGNKNDKIVIRDLAEVDHIEDERLKGGPVTLMFLGYTDAIGSEDQTQSEQQSVIAVERVLITEDGEELLLGPRESDSLQPPSDNVTDTGRDKVSPDVSPNGSETRGDALREEGAKQPLSSPSDSAAERKDSAKRKNCHCCSVM